MIHKSATYVYNHSGLLLLLIRVAQSPHKKQEEPGFVYSGHSGFLPPVLKHVLS